MVGLGVLLLALGAVVGRILLPHVVEPYLRLTLGPNVQRISALTIGVVLASLAVGRLRGRSLRPVDLLVIAVVATFLVDDLVTLNGLLARDLRIYLTAGDQFFHGRPPYGQVVISGPADAARYGLPFLYPPFTLPFFAVLSQLPEGLVIAVWVVVSVVTAAFALRWLGVRTWWIPVLLLWPPVFLGIAVGNVAVLTFGMFAVAPRLPWTLPLMAVFKLQSAVPSIWLVRERRWRSLAIGLGLVVGVALLTLPLVGTSAWADWYRGLQLFQQSEALYPGLNGLALPRYIPYGAYLLVAAVTVVIAVILGKGRAGLARLGIASVVASPSLYRHGFMILLPGLLGNGELLFWLSLGLSGRAVGWAITGAIAAVGTFRFATTERRADTVHPLGPRGAPWSGLGPEPEP